MALFSRIIEWSDDSKNTLVYKYPLDKAGRELNNKSKLIFFILHILKIYSLRTKRRCFIAYNTTTTYGSLRIVVFNIINC